MRAPKSTDLLFGLLFVVLLLVSCQAAPTPAPTPTAVPPSPIAATDPVAPVEAWVDAINKGDVDAALELLADNAEYSAHYLANQGGRVFSGKEQVRPALDYLVGMETKAQVKDCQPQDDRVVCGLSVVHACSAAFGAPDGLAEKLEFIYQPDGKVRKVSFTLDDPRSEDYTRFLFASDAWATENRAQEWAKLDPVDSLLGGSIGAKFCKEYAESLKAAPPTPVPPTPVPPTPPPDPVATVKAWIDAINRGDVNAAVALMTDDVQRLGGASSWSTGKNEVGTTLGRTVGLETKFQIEDCQRVDDRVECAVSVEDACTVAFGAPAGLAAKMEFTLQDGKIRQFSEQNESAESAPIWLWWEKARAWAKANPAGGWAGFDALNREGGEKGAKLCRGYAASLKAAPPTPTADLVAPVKAYVDALNNGDVDAALALFADNAKWADETVRAFGKKQLRTALEWLVAFEVKQQITDCQPQSDRVTCRLSRVGPCYPVPSGASGLSVKLVFIYGPDGKVKQAETGHDGPSWDDVGKWWLARNAWVQANRPDERAKYQDETKEGGLIGAKLCKEYAESLK